MSADNVAPVVPGFDCPPRAPRRASFLYACAGCRGARRKEKLDRAGRCEECATGQISLLTLFDERRG